ncbi:HEAT repeat domain-containing protein [Krasilnikovia sp. MM14-A1259]|uniref:HEAT repeat domain-containing protein n=1 Tax=Krasilnikovia sp. MM14-A1259 TaxID=3373539 RepID=UPI00399C6B77
MTKRFEQAMYLMRRHDPQAMEDGFHLLLPHAAEHIDELIAEFAELEPSDRLRFWLIQLIGEGRSPQALPLFADLLYSDDESLRFWAARGLEKLDTKPARHELWKARANGRND